MSKHDQIADADRERNSEHSAKEGQRHRFEQKLKNDREPGCADRFADADLFGALGDGDEHDIHHADAADQQAEA